MEVWGGEVESVSYGWSVSFSHQGRLFTGAMQQMDGIGFSV